jgi:hypothetical protein
MEAERKPNENAGIIVILTFIVTVLGCLAAWLVVPEIRDMLGLDPKPVVQSEGVTVEPTLKLDCIQPQELAQKAGQLGDGPMKSTAVYVLYWMKQENCLLSGKPSARKKFMKTTRTEVCRQVHGPFIHLSPAAIR